MLDKYTGVVKFLLNLLQPNIGNILDNGCRKMDIKLLIYET